jgi:hypothetical protein
MAANPIITPNDPRCLDRPTASASTSMRRQKCAIGYAKLGGRRSSSRRQCNPSVPWFRTCAHICKDAHCMGRHDDPHEASYADLQAAIHAQGVKAGEYEPVTDDEVIEELSFPVSRRVAIWIMAPAAGSATATEMISIDPAEIAVAHERDRAFEA